MVLTCQSCSRRFNVAAPPTGEGFICRGCRSSPPAPSARRGSSLAERLTRQIQATREEKRLDAKITLPLFVGVGVISMGAGFAVTAPGTEGTRFIAGFIVGAMLIAAFLVYTYGLKFAATAVVASHSI
jgi:hypothetical protein